MLCRRCGRERRVWCLGRAGGCVVVLRLDARFDHIERSGNDSCHAACTRCSGYLKGQADVVGAHVALRALAEFFVESEL